MAKYRVLSLDGGGIRGILTTIVLQRLSVHPDLTGWLDGIDLIAGTSTGGLIALGIAGGLDLGEIRQLYENKGAEVFQDSGIDDLLDIGKLVGADYDTQNLARELERVFGQTTLAQLQRRVLITTFDLDNAALDPARRTWKPKLFHNFPGEDSDGEALACKVGLYTAAAPTYFPSADGYIDGGVYAGNPSMCALAQTQDTRIPDRPSLSDVVLLSLGTGMSLVFLEGQRLNWGYVQWARPLVNLVFDGTAGIADYQCRQMLGERYYRLAPTFPPGVSVPMDGVESVPYLIQFAQGIDLAATVRWIKDTWL